MTIVKRRALLMRRIDKWLARHERCAQCVYLSAPDLFGDHECEYWENTETGKFPLGQNLTSSCEGFEHRNPRRNSEIASLVDEYTSLILQEAPHA